MKEKVYSDDKVDVYKVTDTGLLSDIIGKTPEHHEAHGKGPHAGETAKGTTVGEARSNLEHGSGKK